MYIEEGHIRQGEIFVDHYGSEASVLWLEEQSEGRFEYFFHFAGLGSEEGGLFQEAYEGMDVEIADGDIQRTELPQEVDSAGVHADFFFCLPQGRIGQGAVLLFESAAGEADLAFVAVSGVMGLPLDEHNAPVVIGRIKQGQYRCGPGVLRHEICKGTSGDMRHAKLCFLARQSGLQASLQVCNEFRFHTMEY